MKPTPVTGLLLAATTLLPMIGCAELSEEERPAPALVAAVQVSRQEPQSFCHALGAVDAQSQDDALGLYQSAYESLRVAAAERGADYVVIDAITGPQMATAYEPEMAIHGRLYACGGPAIYRPIAPASCTSSCAPVDEDVCRQ